MEASQETIMYLEQIAERSQEYFDALQFAKQYVLDNDILEKRRIIDCVLLSILWCASNRNDELTEDDVCTLLNVDVVVKKGEISVELVPEMKLWTLEEILEYAKGAHGSL
jgi:hypothetical protein